MTKVQVLRKEHGRAGLRGARWPVAILVTGALVLAPMLSASGAPSPTLKSAKVTSFSGALVDRASKTLYVLSSERGAKLKCTGACLSVWPPLLVKNAVKRISLGANVKGKISFVKRSATTKQVTFNSFPLYTYSGDSGALEAHGEGIAAFSGTWYLVKAASTTANATFLKKTATKVTTTTSGSGSYNY